jgi:hypothetical protein
MELQLDGRVEKFLQEHAAGDDFECTLHKPGSEGDFTLRSLLLDNGFREVTSGLFGKSHEDSVEFFSYYNPLEMSPGFSYVRIDDIGEAFKFNDRYKKMQKNLNRASPKDIIFTVVPGAVTAGIVALLMAYIPNHADSFEKAFLAVASFFAAGFLGGYFAKKRSQWEANTSLSDYKEQIKTGREAIYSAFRYIPKANSLNPSE